MSNNLTTTLWYKSRGNHPYVNTWVVFHCRVSIERRSRLPKPQPLAAQLESEEVSELESKHINLARRRFAGRVHGRIGGRFCGAKTGSFHG